MRTFAPCFFTIGNTCYSRATEGAGLRQKRMGISRGTDPQGQWQNAFSGHPAGFFDAMAITAGTNKSRTQGKP